MSKQESDQLSNLQNVPENQVDSYLINAKAHTPGIKNQDVIQYYTEWSKNYDQDLNHTVYKGPEIIADKVNELISDKSSKILDVGAGTGRVGLLLKKFGFTNVDCLEPSEGMLMVAKSNNSYENYYLEGINADKKTSCRENSYDAVVSAGAFGEGHIKCEGLYELARLTVSNGLVVLIIREEYLSYVEEYANRLEPLMAKMEEENVWRRLARTVVSYYSFNKNGVLFVFKKI